MRYWQGGFVSDVLYIVCLIAIASALRRGIGPMRKLGIPDALVAGAIGLVLGPSVLGVLDFDPNHLEALVYHGLALIFITVSLQSAPKSERAGSAKSIAFAIPITIAMQAVFGLVLLAAQLTLLTGRMPSVWSAACCAGLKVRSNPRRTHCASDCMQCKLCGMQLSTLHWSN